MKLSALIAVCLLFIGCGHVANSPSLTVYHRTSLRRVDVSKQVSPSSLYAFAVQTPPEAVVVRLKRANRVTLHRILHYNAAAIIYDHSGSVANEISEIGFGLLAVVAWPWLHSVASAALWSAHPETTYNPDVKAVRQSGYVRALFNPMRSVFVNNIRIEPVVKQQIFSDTPIVREYEIRVPASEVVVAFRVLDEAGHAVAHGLATTDSYGELQIRGALDHAVAVELSTGGTIIVVPIQPMATPVAAAPVEPAAMPHARVNMTLANGWTKPKKVRSLPRLTWMIDVARLTSLHFTVFGEVRLHRKISVGGLLQREPITYEAPLGERNAKLSAIGGYLRFYAKGNVGTGIHLGFETRRGLSDNVPGSGRLGLVSYGLTVGYKRTLACGRTFEVMSAPRTWKFDDSTAGYRVSDTNTDIYISVGWSF